MSDETPATPVKKPAAAKKPQDRKPKAPAKKAPVTAEIEATEGVEKVTLDVMGVELEVTKGVLNDFELMEHVMAVDVGDTHSIIHAGQGLRKILGLEQYEKAMDHLRNKDTGVVGVPEVLQFFVELIKAILPNS